MCCGGCERYAHERECRVPAEHRTWFSVSLGGNEDDLNLKNEGAFSHSGWSESFCFSSDEGLEVEWVV